MYTGRKMKCLDIFGLNNISFGYGVVESSTTGAIYISYASIVDNHSNDPVFVPAEK